MFFFPKNGIPLGGFNLRFKTWHALPDTNTERKIEDVTAYLAQFDTTLQVIDTTRSDTNRAVSRKSTIASLQFKGDDPSPFFPLFKALDDAASGRQVHIFHYGDSQIECDRMTAILREKMQQQFGGSGPGLICPLPVAATSHCSQSNSGNWTRHTAYGFDDDKSLHNKFGVMCSYARFTPQKKSLAEIDSTQYTEAWLEMRPSGMAQPKSKTFNRTTMYLGNHKLPFTLTVKADDVVISEQTVDVKSEMQMLRWSWAATPKKIRFLFKGADSPDVYAVAFTDTAGVCASNIALRGNDGSALNQVNADEVKAVFTDLGADLIIMQFGGNAVPYLKSAKSAHAYGMAFRQQIQFMQSCAPNAAILVIGPSDMSTSINGNMQTWPYLSDLNDGMKEAAFAEGCAFWDMFNVMGGENSMVSWVTNNPPYAGPDYTHFTSAGARKMAQLLFKAITDEYINWKNAQNIM